MVDQKRGFADETFCPYLGCSSDPASRFMFPNKLHICLKATSNGKIALEYQEKYCLTPLHKECALYITYGNTPLPAKIRRKETVPILKEKPRSPVMLVVIAILAIGGTLGLIFLRQGEQAPQSTALPVAASKTIHPSEATGTPIPSPTPTDTPLPTKTLTTTATRTATATEILSPTPGPALGTPFGNYVLHQVERGESLAMIAIQYQTTVERIEAANIFREGRSIWTGDILVIPIGEASKPEVRFQYVLIEEATLLADLAEAYAVAIDELREYNRLGPLDQVPAGRWLIIPVAGE